MLDEKKLLVIKILLFLLIVLGSAYLWFFQNSSDDSYLYTNGTIITVLEEQENNDDEVSKVFEYYLNTLGLKPKEIIKKDGVFDSVEKYFGSLDTKLTIYFNNLSYRVYFLTDDSIANLYGCYSKDSYCLNGNDKFFAIYNDEIIDVTINVYNYYKHVAEKLVEEESYVFQVVLDYLGEEEEGEYYFGKEGSANKYITKEGKELSFVLKENAKGSYNDENNCWYVLFGKRYFKINNDYEVFEIDKNEIGN